MEALGLDYKHKLRIPSKKKKIEHASLPNPTLQHEQRRDEHEQQLPDPEGDLDHTKDELFALT